MTQFNMPFIKEWGKTKLLILNNSLQLVVSAWAGRGVWKGGGVCGSGVVSFIQLMNSFNKPSLPLSPRKLHVCFFATFSYTHLFTYIEQDTEQYNDTQ